MPPNVQKVKQPHGRPSFDELVSGAVWHKKGRFGGSQEPSITIGRSGRIGINQTAWKQYFEGKGTGKNKEKLWAELGYNENLNEVLLSVKSKKLENGYTVRVDDKHHSAAINCGKKFLRDVLHIEPDEMEKNHPIETTIDDYFLGQDLLILELKQD